MGLKIDYDDSLKAFLTDNLFDDRKAEITRINLSYDLDRQVAITNEKKKAIQAKKNALKIKFKTGNYPPSITAETLERDIQAKEEELEKLEEEYLSGVSKSFAGWAFVSFKTEADKEEAIRLYHPSLKKQIRMLLGIVKKTKHSLVFNGNQLIIEQAASPTDVFWENLKFTEKQKLSRRVVGFLIQIVLILACALAVFGLNAAQEHYKKMGQDQKGEKPKTSTTTQILTLLIAMAIPFVNFILVTCIKMLAK